MPADDGLRAGSRSGRGRARGGGEEREVLAVARGDAGQPLHEGRPDLPCLQLGAERALHVEQGEDGRFGEEAGETEEHLLSSPHAGQPVVDEGGLDRSQRVSSAATAGTLTPRAFMYPAWIACAERSQLNSWARARPRADRSACSAGSHRTSSSPRAMSSGW